MTKTELFLKLAQPDAEGKSRWVYVTEFVGEYAGLKFGNLKDILQKKFKADSVGCFFENKNILVLKNVKITV